MKKYLWMLVAVCFLSACSKDEEEGPYVPWRPGDQTEETIELDKATKVMILTEQSKNRILMIDQPTGKIAWEWKAADSGLSVSEHMCTCYGLGRRRSLDPHCGQEGAFLRQAGWKSPLGRGASR